MNKDTIHDLQMLVWNSSNAFADMRLLVEGAITLYEDDAEASTTMTPSSHPCSCDSSIGRTSSLFTNPA